MLDKYIKNFGRLHTDKNKRWGKRLTFRAPHKPLLLLSILDRFAEGALQANLIEFDDDLLALFNIYWHLVDPPSRRGNIGYPLWHLQSDGFWHLLPRPGKEERVRHGGAINSLAALRRAVFGARLDQELYQLLQDEGARDVLRAVLIETYFDQALQAKLAAQGLINQQAYAYGQELLAQVKGRRVQETAEHGYETAVRDQGFRRAITTVYDHRCALCGIRMLTPEGHTAVDAAHIIPWAVSHNDDPRNGLALCRLCHWTFDEGMLAVSTGYLVKASPRLRAERNLPAHLAALDGRGMIRPADADYWPAAQSLTWHMAHIYRRR